MNEATSARMQQENDEKNKVADKHKEEKSGSPSLNMNELRELAELIDEYGLVDFEFENANIRVHMRKQMPPGQMPVQYAPVAHAEAGIAPMAAHGVETPHPGAKAETEAAVDDGLHKITSPIVGTYYQSPSPDTAPFIKVGDKVSNDTVVCIIEAMKLMNEIQAECAGEVVKIYVENGQPVEFGQPLFAVK
jgi:acetyl-CoA carboxylase biotin carboxyl carrier protein